MKFSDHGRKFSLYWIGLVTTLFVTFFITAWQITVRPLQFQAPVRSDWGNFSSYVTLTAEAISVDPISRTIIMNWYPKFTTPNCSTSTPTVMDIFVNWILLDDSSPSLSSSAQFEDKPVYRLNTTEICWGGMVSTYSSFRTVTKIIASKDYLRLQAITLQSTFQSYPFDIYLAPFLFYTQNVNTGETTPVEISDSFGVAVNFKISLHAATVSYNGVKDSTEIFLRIERSIATKAFVIIVGVTNWLIAIAFLTICVALIVYQSVEIYSEMFAIPVTTLFAFSSIRGNFPGAPPGFGANIDTFTILPVLVIMSLCSFALLLTILYRRIYENIKKKSRMTCGATENEVMPAPLLSALSPNQSVISIPRLQSPRSSSEVTSTEPRTKQEGTADQINIFLEVPHARSRDALSEITRVQE